MLLTLLFMFLGVVLCVGVLDDPGGIPIGLLLGWLLGDHVRLRQRLQRLERQAGLAPPEAPPVDDQAVFPSAAPPSEGRTPPAPAQVPADPWLTSPPPAPSLKTEAPRPAPEVAAASGPGPLGRALAWLGGGNPLVRIGVVLLFFGVAFLLKYASQTFSPPLELRFMATALGGLALLLVGWRLRERRPGYAMVLQGGGVGVLYLTLFVATRFDLVPPELAFPLLVALAVLSALLALGQDAPALALFGAAGGYLAPVLVSTGGGSHVALFSYYALLNGGVLGLAWFKSWRSLNLLGFLFTFVIGAAWGHQYYQPAYLASTEPFLILFFLMYVAISVLFALRQPVRLRGYVDGPLVFGLPIVAFALQAGLARGGEFALAWSAVALGAFYLGLALVLWRRQGAGLRLLCEAFLALGVVFATLAVPLALDNRWTAAAWALEGAALVWIGVRQGRLLARLSGLLLQILAGLAFALSWLAPAGDLPVLNGRCLGGLLIALAALFSAWYPRRYPDQLRPWEPRLGWLPLVWGLLWWYGTGIHEIQRFVPLAEQVSALLLFWAASAALGIGARRPLAWPQAGIPALLLLPAAALLLGRTWASLHLFPWVPFLPPPVGLTDSLVIAPYHPFMGIGALAWLAVFLVQYGGLARLDGDFPSPSSRRLWHAASLWLLAWVLAWELAWWFGQATQGESQAWPLAVWGALPAGLALWVIRRGPQVRPWPFAAYRADYLLLGCAPLLGFAWGWSLLANLDSDGAPWPLPYLPLLNPLDLAMLFLGLSLLTWWTALRAEQPDRAARWRRPLIGAGGAAGFLWVTAVVARTVHHWGGVPFAWGALMGSTSFHTALSLVWTGLALVVMAWAARRSARVAWLAGAALLGLVVVKLFLVELASSGTMARIVSFLGVGLLLLVIGYLAPLPPRPGGPAQGEPRP